LALKRYALLIWLFSLLLFWEAACDVALWSVKRLWHITYTPIQEDALDPGQRDVLEKLIEGRTEYVAHDQDLGWTIKPNGSTDLFRANSAGLRGDKEYSELPSSELVRIATFGDSFTHGDEVRNEDTWQAQLERCNAKLEVLNFGVGGYGPDQAYLRYQKVGRKYSASIILIGFLSENIYRTMNVFRPFYAPHNSLPLSKPRFLVQDGKFILLPNPLSDLQHYRKLLDEPAAMLKQLGSNDWFYHNRYRAGPLDIVPSVRLFKMFRYQFLENDEFLYHPQTEAFKLSLGVLSKFVNDARIDSSHPVIVLFPGMADVERAIRGQPTLYKALLQALREKDLDVVDLIEAFSSKGNASELKRLFENNGHYSKSGNAVVTNYLYKVIANALREQQLHMPEGHTEFNGTFKIDEGNRYLGDAQCRQPESRYN
jgi:hypothetical protein